MGDEADPLVEKIDCIQVAERIYTFLNFSGRGYDRATKERWMSREIRGVVEAVVAGIEYTEGVPPLTPDQAQAFVDHLTDGPPWRCRGCLDYDEKGDKVRKWNVMGALVGRWHRKCLVASLEAVAAKT